MDPNTLAETISETRFELKSCRLAVQFGEEDFQQLVDWWEAALDRQLDMLTDELHPPEPEPFEWPVMRHLTPWTFPINLPDYLPEEKRSGSPYSILPNLIVERKYS